MNSIPDLPLGVCWCGCGQPTPIAVGSDPRVGKVKGQPCPYLAGHSSRSWPRSPITLEDGIGIPLTQGAVCIVSLEDSDLATLKWCLRDPLNPYAIRNVPQAGGGWRITRMHRLILERKLGRPLRASEEPDHIDGNGLNNRRTNLRLATHAQNSKNTHRRSNATGPYKGVGWDAARKRWRAQIGIDGHHYMLGRFTTAEEARDAYERAADEAFGEWRRR